jgi:hypothetical protein
LPDDVLFVIVEFVPSSSVPSPELFFVLFVSIDVESAVDAMWVPSSPLSWLWLAFRATGRVTDEFRLLVPVP